MFDQVRAFHQPRTMSEALRLLHRRDGGTCVVAGGTDLILRAGRTATALVDIGRLGLDYIKTEARSLRIGATTTMASLEQSAEVLRFADAILAIAAASCGGVQTRNLATIGGNLMNASPAADLATPLLVLDAEVVLRGLRTRRVVPIGQFFRGPHQTTANGFLLVEAVIPVPKPRSAFSFQKFARTETDIAIVNVAAAIQVDRSHRCASARLALGSVAPHPMRARAAEALLSGKVLTRELIENAADTAAQETRPITDVRASAEYKRDLCRILLRRALAECAQRLEVEV